MGGGGSQATGFPKRPSKVTPPPRESPFAHRRVCSQRDFFLSEGSHGDDCWGRGGNSSFPSCFFTEKRHSQTSLSLAGDFSPKFLEQRGQREPLRLVSIAREGDLNRRRDPPTPPTYVHPLQEPPSVASSHHGAQPGTSPGQQTRGVPWPRERPRKQQDSGSNPPAASSHRRLAPSPASRTRAPFLARAPAQMQGTRLAGHPCSLPWRHPRILLDLAFGATWLPTGIRPRPPGGQTKR